MNIRKEIGIVIFICTICLVILIAILANSKEEFKPTLQEDITTIEKVCEYYNIEYISEEDIADFEFTKQVFLKFPYDTYTENGTSSRNYYEDVIHELAKVYEYKDIIVLDDEKGLKIEIESNETIKAVENYTINGDRFYFENLESKLNLSKISNIELKEMNVESQILKDLIINNWNVDNINFGTKETDLYEYEIYFDEGLQVRKIAGKVFNIVFTDKYTSDIVDGFSVNTDLSEIKNKFGNSSFEETADVIGYKTKDFYIFFSNGQISIYRVDTYDTKEFANLVTTFIDTKDEKEFTKKIKELWPDYDYFSENENDGQIELTYSLKGVKFNINMSKEHGVALYSNFNGQVINNVSFEQLIKKEEKIPNNVFVKNSDLVYLNEVNRSFDVYNHEMTVQKYKYMYEDSKDKELDIFYDNTQTDFIKPSSKFFCLKDGLTVMVFSYENSYPPAEIEKVYSFLWADDTHLLYSVNKQGIYMYDAVSRNIKTIISGEGEYKIDSYVNGILDYDNESIECNIE